MGDRRGSLRETRRLARTRYLVKLALWGSARRSRVAGHCLCSSTSFRSTCSVYARSGGYMREARRRAAASSLIRGTLLPEGIEIREVGDSEPFVSRSADSRVESLRLPLPSFPASLSPSPAPRVRGVTQRPSPSP